MELNKQILVSYKSIAILRVMLSGIFIIASLNHMFHVDKTIAKMDESRLGYIGHMFGDPTFPIVLSGGIMLLSGISLLVGFKTKYAALSLALVLIPITITVQVGQISTLGPLFKNVAIMGGLIFFISNNFKDN